MVLREQGIITFFSCINIYDLLHIYKVERGRERCGCVNSLENGMGEYGVFWSNFSHFNVLDSCFPHW